MHHSLPKVLRGVVWIGIIVGMHFLFLPESGASSGEQIVGYVEQVKGSSDGYRIDDNGAKNLMRIPFEALRGIISATKTDNQ